jgi:hypothetical protein
MLSGDPGRATAVYPDAILGHIAGSVSLLVTVDTNQLDFPRIDRIRRSLRVPFQLACVSVTERERGPTTLMADLVSVPETGVWAESRWGEAVWAESTPELLTLDESPLDTAGLAADEHVNVLEAALRVISDGSFPPSGSRDQLSRGQRRQLRDAMIFEAHTRDRRHLLVTSDAKGFINDGRRQALEALGRTRIATPDELEAMSTSEQAALLQ